MYKRKGRAQGLGWNHEGLRRLVGPQQRKMGRTVLRILGETHHVLCDESSKHLMTGAARKHFFLKSQLHIQETKPEPKLYLYITFNVGRILGFCWELHVQCSRGQCSLNVTESLNWTNGLFLLGSWFTAEPLSFKSYRKI